VPSSTSVRPSGTGGDLVAESRTLSLSALTVLPCSPLELIEAAASAGFTHTGLRITQAMEGDVDVLGDTALMRQIAQSLRDTNLSPMDLELTRISPDKDVTEDDRLFAFAQTIGAPFVTITAAGTEAWSAEEESEVCHRLEALGARAASFGVRLSLEFMPYRAITDLAYAVRIVRTVDTDAVGLCIDSLHLQRSGGHPTEIAAIDPALIALVQVCDAPRERREGLSYAREARSDRLFPGDGELPLAELVAAVPTDVPLSIEVPLYDRDGLSAKDLAERAYTSLQRLLVV
jgi:sugar phosphate isomerase/epimerase